MTKQEFKREFDGLHARYPGFVMPEPKSVMRIYYQDLGLFSTETLRRAIPEIMAASPLYFPTAAVIVKACEAAQAITAMQGRIPRPKYYPAEHGCNLHKKQEMSQARRLLFEVSPYEGFHVLCRGEMHSVCPECGTVQAPFENPFIVLLMEQYPEETQGWNSDHKGNLLCKGCETIDGPFWISKLNSRRLEARR